MGPKVAYKLQQSLRSIILKTIDHFVSKGYNNFSIKDVAYHYCEIIWSWIETHKWRPEGYNEHGYNGKKVWQMIFENFQKQNNSL